MTIKTCGGCINKFTPTNDNQVVCTDCYDEKTANEYTQGSFESLLAITDPLPWRIGLTKPHYQDQSPDPVIVCADGGEVYEGTILEYINVLQTEIKDLRKRARLRK